MNELSSHAKTWTDFKSILISEISQPEIIACYMTSFVQLLAKATL